MLAVLFADVDNPDADLPGDNVYRQIQEAVDVAAPGDTIKVRAGTYEPFVVNTDNITIREATKHSNPVIDGDLNAGDEIGVRINSNGVTVK